ncbi:DUF3102 domain-containing protein [Leptospira noguchii]|uniref:DUF3102 domain-containing protein n=1 Tax=Leptospira noguchii TaxID=28182 RepID=UPI001FB6235F|nr:DUF3102 domain-containing protein [Leptospira noguchii]UOG32763.1 DUF3102 domain-containing protein [Leptospira noguchii]
MNKKEEKRNALRISRPGGNSNLLLVQNDEDLEVQEIIDLHKGVESLLSRGVESIIRIGERLAKKKQELKHGEFQKWVEINFIVDHKNPKYFSMRTARRYIQAYTNQDRIANADSIRTAYKILSESTKEEIEINPLNEEENPEVLFKKFESGIKLSKSEKSIVNKYLIQRKEKLFFEVKRKAAKIDEYLKKLGYK